MATMENFVVRVMRKRRMQGLPEAKKHEIRQEVVDGIRIIQDQVPADALKDLFRSQIKVMDGDSYIEVTIQRLISLKSIESDGDYGYPWTEVDRQLFNEIKRNEQEAAHDSTDTRIFCVRSAEVAGYDLYPVPADGRFLWLDYITPASEAGVMTLPDHLHLAVILYASGMHDEFASDVNRISRAYRNRYGLTPAIVSIGRGL